MQIIRLWKSLNLIYLLFRLSLECNVMGAENFLFCLDFLENKLLNGDWEYPVLYQERLLERAFDELGWDVVVVVLGRDVACFLFLANDLYGLGSFFWLTSDIGTISFLPSFAASTSEFEVSLSTSRSLLFIEVGFSRSSILSFGIFICFLSSSILNFSVSLYLKWKYNLTLKKVHNKY